MSSKAELVHPETILSLTTEIISSHVARNAVLPSDVPPMIEAVHGALAGLAEPEPEVPPLEPAVPVRKSVTPDYIICLEDGRKLKMLKRHLRTAYDLSPEEYRAKWGLPPDYPMVAPNYAKRRKELAAEIGLGRNRGG